MTVEIALSVLALLVSLGAAFFSWLAASRANRLSQVSTLLSLRAYYVEESRRHTEFARNNRDFESVLRSGALASEEMSEKIRGIDAQLSRHFSEVTSSSVT